MRGTNEKALAVVPSSDFCGNERLRAKPISHCHTCTADSYTYATDINTPSSHRQRVCCWLRLYHQWREPQSKHSCGPPKGDVFATLPCADEGQGRYLSDYVRLPLRGTEDTWPVVARATRRRDGRAQVEQTFKGLSSFSEELQSPYGFWIELSDLFPYNVPYADDPRNKYWPYEDGGYVILANNFFAVGPTITL